MKYIATIDEQEFEIEINDSQDIFVNGEPYRVEMQRLGKSNLASLIIDHRSYETVVSAGQDGHLDVLIGNEIHDVLVQDELTYRVAQANEDAAGAAGSMTLKSPMPGLILKIPVAVGDEVTKGETVIILESMKMENELKSPRDGIVQVVYTEQGASVEKNQNLITIGDVD